MNIESAYNQWAQQYDSNENRTRDLEAQSIREMLSDITFEHCLEIGCGTGKNTLWLAKKGSKITAIDLSENMLAIARKKVKSENVQFIKADILQDWDFEDEKFDLVVCSLVLEHIENIRSLFNKISKHLATKATIYIGELHPIKQYLGSQARFESKEGEQTVTAYTHHLSDFTEVARENSWKISKIKEFFDDESRNSPPRILAIKFTLK